MLSLLPLMVEKVGLIIVIAFFIANTKIFNNILKENSAKEKTALIVLFSAVSIISNITGVEIAESQIIQTGWHVQVVPQGALANTRIMAVGIGGLLGGPLVGLCVGLSAGISRMLMGGFTAVECSVSSVIAGTISGFVGNYLRQRGRSITPLLAMFLGVGLELMQMGIILLFAKPFAAALGLVQVIALPMSVINAAGSFIFLSIVVLSQEKKDLAEAEHQRKLLQDAEIRALQAQINPHFLFNAINAISSLCRTDAEKARTLLLNLATYFRSNLQGARQMFITVERELAHIEAYMSIQQARLPGKFNIIYAIDDSLKQALIPPFTLQMLVENACCHGFNDGATRGEVRVEIARIKANMRVCVADNGCGIPRENLAMLGQKELVSPTGTGSALFNINQRLQGLYNKPAALSIESQEAKGTTVTFTVPLIYDDTMEG